MRNFYFQIIPRTQRVDAKSQQLSQEEFLSILIPKLETVKVEQERMELLNRKLLEVIFLISQLIEYRSLRNGF